MSSKSLREGTYRGRLILNSETGRELPFNFDVRYNGSKPVIIIRNSQERITVDEITIKGDSVNFKMPGFDTEFKCKLTKNGLEGNWLNHYRTTLNVIPFIATFGESDRFIYSNPVTSAVLDGQWEVTFSPGSADSSKAIGKFMPLEGSEMMSGTFLTETGDYRYLEGIRAGNQLFLSAFDGSHAVLFEAELKGSVLTGTFYSGAHHTEIWTAKRNSSFKLKDPEEITFLKNKEEKIEFSFIDINGNMVSLADEKFKNKPVIIQLMGSWCPNCMDESVYFAELYYKFHNAGLQIVALAFEKTTDLEKSRQQVKRMAERLALPYDVLLTQSSGKDKASELFPALNKVSAFPTSIFLDKNHNVSKIHTGFSGPATGSEYFTFKERTENLIKNLLKE